MDLQILPRSVLAHRDYYCCGNSNIHSHVEQYDSNPVRENFGFRV